MTAKTCAAHAAPAHAADSAAPTPTPSTAPAPARTAPPAAPAAGEHRTTLGPSAGALFEGLFARALPMLSPADLDDLAMQGETATLMVGGLSELCMGLGCLLNGEAEDIPSHARSGVFQQPDELARLLFLLANVADQAHGLLQLASLADTMRSLDGRA